MPRAQNIMPRIGCTCVCLATPLIASFIRVCSRSNDRQGGLFAVRSLRLTVAERILEARLMAATTAVGAVPGRRRAPAPPLKQSQSSDQLKLRFLTADRNYETIKQLARKGKCWPMPANFTQPWCSQYCGQYLDVATH